MLIGKVRKLAAAHGLHYDNGKSAFLEIFKLFVCILEGIIEVVELYLAEFKLVSVGFHKALDYGKCAVDSAFCVRELVEQVSRLYTRRVYAAIATL